MSDFEQLLTKEKKANLRGLCKKNQEKNGNKWFLIIAVTLLLNNLLVNAELFIDNLPTVIFCYNTYGNFGI